MGRASREVVNLKIELAANFLLNYVGLNTKLLYLEHKKLSKKLYWETLEGNVEESLIFLMDKFSKVKHSFSIEERSLRLLFEKFENINQISRQVLKDGEPVIKNFMEEHYGDYLCVDDLTFLDFKQIVNRAPAFISGDDSSSSLVSNKKHSKAKSAIKAAVKR